MNLSHVFQGTILLLLINNTALSAEYFQADSINIINNGPVSNLFGFAQPDILTNRAIGTVSLSAQQELSNYISATIKQEDSFFIDGETWVLRNTLRYQLSENLIISSSIPWYKHSGGVADSLIYNFHDLLQLPQNGRTENHQDALRWRLSHNNQTLLDVENDMSGWGDVSITAQLTPHKNPSVRWTFMTKLPTGDMSKQTGSESFDFGIAVSQINPEWVRNRSFLTTTQLAFWYGAGLTYLGEVDTLTALGQKPYALSFRSGVAYAPFHEWHLKCQLDARTPLYKTKIRELGWHSMLISFSTMHALSKSTQLEFTIVEDMRPRSGPDVIFQTRLETFF